MPAAKHSPPSSKLCSIPYQQDSQFFGTDKPLMMIAGSLVLRAISSPPSAYTGTADGTAVRFGAFGVFLCIFSGVPPRLPVMALFGVRLGELVQNRDDVLIVFAVLFTHSR